MDAIKLSTKEIKQMNWKIVLLVFFGIVFGNSALAQGSGWEFDWDIRNDRDGKPAGIYTETPFPIDENTISYSIKSDEYPEGKTYYLGTKYFVDGAYTGGSNDGSWEHPWTSISEALSNAGSGNTAIIVRGAHDGFDGIYYGTYSLSNHYGVDDTHRFMIVGYGQERPIFDGQGATSIIFTYQNSNRDDAYITLQRLQIQRCYL